MNLHTSNTSKKATGNMVSIEVDSSVLDKFVTKRTIRLAVKAVLNSGDIDSVFSQSVSELVQSVMLQYTNLATINKNQALRDRTLERTQEFLFKGIKKFLRDNRPCKRIVNPDGLPLQEIRNYLDLVEKYQQFTTNNHIVLTKDSDDEE